ncbi:uracil phosphoribosyltransferase [Fontibacter flavus]|uniref:Uracil phosphoribosyltransferase n=1 Tax=Fontibacter flavus TaxID=654838 RepID=A0ABV6FPG1_9BACT
MFILDHQNSIVHQFMTEIRDVQVQKDRLRFRRNFERLGEIMAYEISKDLGYRAIEIQTPLQKTTARVLNEKPVLISVMRAAIPFYQGFLNYFDQADSGFVGAYRKEEKEGDQEIEIEFLYQAAPNLEGREVILVDPMLATGKSFVKTVENLLRNGKPKMLHLVCLIAAPEGVEYLKQNLKLPYKLWVGALDEKLNEKFYIVPGLGDAGDLCFGDKI